MGSKKLLTVAVAAILITGFAALAVGARSAYRAPEVHEITLVARGMAFRIEGQTLENPDLPLRSGERLLLRFVNDDPGVRHDFAVPSLGVRTRVLDPGEEERVSILVLHPSTHEYLCTLHPLMMKGAILVRAD
jgi:plastocyanin